MWATTPFGGGGCLSVYTAGVIVLRTPEKSLGLGKTEGGWGVRPMASKNRCSDCGKSINAYNRLHIDYVVYCPDCFRITLRAQELARKVFAYVAGEL